MLSRPALHGLAAASLVLTACTAAPPTPATVTSAPDQPGAPVALATVAPTVVPTATSTAAPTPPPNPTAPSPPTPTPGPAVDTRLAGQTRYVANTEGLGVKVRSACDDQTGMGGWPDGVPVTIEYARADCSDWLLVKRSNGDRSWVRFAYLANAAPVVVATRPIATATVTTAQAAKPAPTLAPTLRPPGSPTLPIIAASPVPGTLCRDGWVSPSTGSGTCSSHGGVASATSSTSPRPPVSAASSTASGGSCPGCISPETGRPQTVYVPGYTRKDGTYVRPHWRSPPRPR